MSAKIPATLCRSVSVPIVSRKAVRWPKVKMSYGRLRARSQNRVRPFARGRYAMECGASLGRDVHVYQPKNKDLFGLD